MQDPTEREFRRVRASRSQIPCLDIDRGALSEMLKGLLKPRLGAGPAPIAQIRQEAALGIQLRSGAEPCHQPVG